MNKIELDQWYVNGNNMSIDLGKFNVSIKTTNNRDGLNYETIINDNDNSISIVFNSLEDAISFTEKIVRRCSDIENVMKKYNDLKKLFNYNSHDSNKYGNMVLVPEELEQAIIDYFSEGVDYDFSVKDELYVEDDEVKLRFCLIGDLGEDKKVKTILTDTDISNALKQFLDEFHLYLISYYFIGGMYKEGYRFDENTHLYDGLNLTVKEKKIDNRVYKKRK